MWKRRVLKQKARKVVKESYWAIIVVCFLLALFTGEFGTSIIGLWQTNDSMDPIYIIHQKNLKLSESLDTTIIKKVEEKATEVREKFNSLNETEKKVWKVLQDNLNSLTKPQKSAFHIYDAIVAFMLKQSKLGATLIFVAILSLAFAICIADPLTVGGKRFFIKIRTEKDTKAGVLTEIFKDKVWQNVALTILLKNIYIFLWYFTIIGGFIKTYEYRMVPYILAENLTVNRKQAFKLSKQMMKGNKWRAFLLDLSFLGWNILSVFTFGLLKLLYINPYQAITKAELYAVLKNKAIEEKYTYYEVLNGQNFDKN